MPLEHGVSESSGEKSSASLGGCRASRNRASTGTTWARPSRIA